MSKQTEFNYYNDATRYSMMEATTMSEFKACADCNDPAACKLAMGCELEEYTEDELDEDDFTDEEDKDQMTGIKEPLRG